MNGLDLFSGIGGLTIAMEGIARPVAYCENDRFAQAVLLSRQRDGGLPIAPIWDDVRTLKANVLPAGIDIIWGGFPCQDISVAGLGRGLVGERSGLFWHIARLVKETNPKFVFLENVPAIRTRGLNQIVQTFTEIGYDCRWTVISAAEVGAPHIRKRWFLLAYSNSERVRFQSRRGKRAKWKKKIWTINDSKDVPNPNGPGCQRKNTPQSKKWINNFEFIRNSYNKGWEKAGSWWEIEPDVGRVVNGLPNRVERVKCLGNAVVPAQAREAFKRLIRGKI